MKPEIFNYSSLINQRLLYGPSPMSGGFVFEFEDFIFVHSLVVSRFLEMDATLEKRSKEFEEKSKLMGEIKDEEELESYRVMLSRQREFIFSADHQNKRVLHNSSSMCVIGLWAMCEKNLIRIFKRYHEIKGIAYSENDVPEKWDEFKVSYKKLGRPLSEVDFFSDVNECRILNNSIKHGEVVGPDLGGFKAFHGMVGRELSKVDFDVKRYAVGIHNFIQVLYELLE